MSPLRGIQYMQFKRCLFVCAWWTRAPRHQWCKYQIKRADLGQACPILFKSHPNSNFNKTDRWHLSPFNFISADAWVISWPTLRWSRTFELQNADLPKLPDLGRVQIRRKLLLRTWWPPNEKPDRSVTSHSARSPSLLPSKYEIVAESW